MGPDPVSLAQSLVHLLVAPAKEAPLRFWSGILASIRRLQMARAQRPLRLLGNHAGDRSTHWLESFSVSKAFFEKAIDAYRSRNQLPGQAG
jgi:hypothetical protein